jgi:hemin uptake protein HemP
MTCHTPPPAATSADSLPTYAAVDLTCGAGQARIVLGEQIYTLRITRAGKLILTK